MKYYNKLAWLTVRYISTLSITPLASTLKNYRFVICGKWTNYIVR